MKRGYVYVCVCAFCTHLEKKESGTQVRVCLEVLNLETQICQSHLLWHKQCLQDNVRMFNSTEKKLTCSPLHLDFSASVTHMWHKFRVTGSQDMKATERSAEIAHKYQYRIKEELK